jgi:hypothetical protein
MEIVDIVIQIVAREPASDSVFVASSFYEAVLVDKSKA